MTLRNEIPVEKKRPVGVALHALVYIVLGVWLSWPEARSRSKVGAENKV